MKKLSVFLCAAILIFGLAASAGATMIMNGGFDENFDYWNTRGDVQIGDTNDPLGGIAEAQGMDGQFALLGFQPFQNGVSQIRQDFKIPESGKVTISFNWAFDYLDFSGHDEDTVMAIVRDDDGVAPTNRITLGELSSTFPGGVEHGFFTGTFDLSHYVTEDARLIFRLNEADSSRVFSAAGFDNISVSAAPVPEPSTILLLGVGLVGLVGVGRKRFAGKR